MRILRFVQSLTLFAFFVAFVGIIFPTNLHSQEMIEIDVIHIEDGSTIRGIIEKAGSTYKIVKIDGDVFRTHSSNILSTTKETVELQNTKLEKRYPVAAFFASFFVPGLGQMVVNKDYVKGVVFLVGTAGGYYLFATNFNIFGDSNDGLLLAGALLMNGCWIGSWIEAPITAYSYNKKLRRLRTTQGIGTVSLFPTINQFNVADKQVLSYGISLKLNF